MNCLLPLHIFSIFWSRGMSQVEQTPTDLLLDPDKVDKLACKHSINNYNTILWYFRSQEKTHLTPVGHTIYTGGQTVEKPFEGVFGVSGNGQREAFLHLLNLTNFQHAGHLFCAAVEYTVKEKALTFKQKTMQTFHKPQYSKMR